MKRFSDRETELIDKCVGSKIWVVMKGDKGWPVPFPKTNSAINLFQNSAARLWVSTTTLVSNHHLFTLKMKNMSNMEIDMVLEDVTEL